MWGGLRVQKALGAAALTVLATGLVSGCSDGTPDAAGADPMTRSSTPEASPSSEASASASATPSPSPTASPEATVSPTPEASPTPPPTPTPTPTPAETTAPPAPEPPPMPARGASGDQVRGIQQRLADLGYYLPGVDGDFGPGTQQAVWALQKSAGLYRDGVVGPATQAALDQGVRPQARTSSGKAIEIDLNRQLLLAVEDGRVVAVINASSGNGERYEAQGRSYRAFTPTGSFAVGRQVDGMHSSSLELGEMWRPKFFNGGIAVHGSGSIPPYPASHGCVRVSNSAMNWIWDVWRAPAGTPVVVY